MDKTNIASDENHYREQTFHCVTRRSQNLRRNFWTALDEILVRRSSVNSSLLCRCWCFHYYADIPFSSHFKTCKGSGKKAQTVLVPAFYYVIIVSRQTLLCRVSLARFIKHRFIKAGGKSNPNEKTTEHCFWFIVSRHQSFCLMKQLWWTSKIASTCAVIVFKLHRFKRRVQIRKTGFGQNIASNSWHRIFNHLNCVSALERLRI